MEGWVLDVYPDYSRNLLIVWLKDVRGKVHKLVDLFEPSFYVGGGRATSPGWRRACSCPLATPPIRVRGALSGGEQATLVRYAMER